VPRAFPREFRDDVMAVAGCRETFLGRARRASNIHHDGDHLYLKEVISGEIIHAGSRGILNERC
jgi:hypothetical protein